MLVVILAALAVPAAPALPEALVVPSVTEAIGIDQELAVRDGKLWERRRSQGGWGAWGLFLDTGLPPGVARPLVAVFADEVSQLTVVDDSGAMHHYENGVWDSLWGFPNVPIGRTTLALPFPHERLRDGSFAYSMRRDHALYYEDIVGQKFWFGDVGCTSIWALHPDDDTRILFGDPWVAPDWSRETCGPARGGVRIASIAASGSMLFVIAKDGRLFSRFDDYDHNGGTPLLPYAYVGVDGSWPRGVHHVPPDTRESSIQVRALPGFDWRAQPAIPREGRARVSRRIGVVQTGHGNDARELRVIGDGPDGRRGVYVKQVRDPSWRFAPAPPSLATPAQLVDGPYRVRDDEWIDPRAAADAAPRAWAMAGPLEGPASLGWAWARTEDFSFHCAPFTLTLTLGAGPGQTVELVVHAVDAWTLFQHANAVDDDTAPRLLKLTLQLAPGQALSAATRARVDELFQGALGEAFAFVGVANQHELVIAPLGYPFTAARSRWQLVLRASPEERGRRHVTLRPASQLAARLAPHGPHAPHDARGACDALDAVRAQRADIQRRQAFFATLEVGLPAGLGVADAATVATTTRYTWGVMRWLVAFEQHVPAITSAPALAYARWLDASAADFEVTERALAARCAR